VDHAERILDAGMDGHLRHDAVGGLLDDGELEAPFDLHGVALLPGA
jgi:hypothetical protein